MKVYPVTKKWDGVDANPDTNWFTKDVEIVRRFSDAVKHTFQFSCPTATIINLQLKFNGITKIHNFNGGVEIGINDGEQFDVILHKGMTYNIQHKTGIQNVAVIIVESANLDV